MKMVKYWLIVKCEIFSTLLVNERLSTPISPTYISFYASNFSHLKKNAIMKKIVLTLSLLLTLGAISFAQTTPKDKKPATTTTKPAATTTHTKKDGTADMRYKENKDAAKAKPATAHVKADGTPDKRYKENKPAKAK